MIILQTLILALFPVILYLIGIDLDLPLAGFLAALFVILRELNSIQAMDYANVSNSKLLLSEPFTTLLVCLFTYVTIRWIKGRFFRIPAGMILGGLIGLMSLVRIQSLVLFPLIIIIACVVYFRRWKYCGQFILFFLPAAVCIILPTIMRSGSISGYYWLEQPLYVNRLRDFYGQSGSLLTSIIENIMYIIHHFMRNTISSFLIFPLRFSQVNNISQLFRIGDPFWSELPSGLTIHNIFFILLNMAIISHGCSTIWRKNRIFLVFLFLLYILYNLSSSFFRLSGWRYVLPIDWVFIFFYCIGLAGLLQHFLHSPHQAPAHEELVLANDKPAQKVFLKYAGIWLFMLFLSSIIPLREIFISKSFHQQSKAEICQEVISDSTFMNSGVEVTSFMDYCVSEDTQVLKGLAFYPRFIKKDQFLTARSADIIYGPQSYSRLAFKFLGYDTRNVFIRLEESPEIFPNHSEMIVLGNTDAKMEAQFVLLRSSGRNELFVSSYKN
jgi:hypothetical protein